MAVLAGLLFISCIERSNPFDPINARGTVAATVRAANQAKLDALSAQRAELAAFLSEYLAGFSKAQGENGVTSGINAAVWAANLQTENSNIVIEAANTALPESLYAQLQYKTAFGLLTELAGYGPPPGFEERRTRLKALASEVSGFMSEVNSRNAPVDVYPQSYRDSIISPIARDTLAFSRLSRSIDSGNAAVADTNAAIRLYNSGRLAEKRNIELYNANMDFLRQSRGNKVIVSADSLNAATKVAMAGDTLFLGPGLYNVDLRFDNSGTLNEPIVVRGHPSKTTVLTASTSVSGGSAVVLSSRSNIHFEDLVFRKGGTSGVKLIDFSRNIVFRRCMFDSSGTWGVEAIDSYFEMENSLVINNGGGIRATGIQGEDATFILLNNLIAQNRGRGLEALSAGGFIENCTFSGNAGEGIYIRSPTQSLSIRNSIVSSNLIAGIWREPTTWVPNSLTVQYTDVWGNDPVDWNLSGITTEQVAEVMATNYNFAPEFVDPANFNYVLKPGSELADWEVNPPYLKIGYRP